MAPDDLPIIPVIDLGAAPCDHLAALAPDKVQMLAAAGRALTTAPVQAWMDRRSKTWLNRNVTPYKAEIDRVAALPGISGVYALNISTEWACSSMVHGGRLMRTLDWPLHGMGPSLTVTRHDAAVGAWWQATWPGFVGVLTGMAPGRFAASYNQPPIRRRSGIKPLDWVIERIGVDRRTAIPPTHAARDRAGDSSPFQPGRGRWPVGCDRAAGDAGEAAPRPGRHRQSLAVFGGVAARLAGRLAARRR